MRQSRLLIRAAVAIVTMALAVPGWLAVLTGSAAAMSAAIPAPTQPVPGSPASATGAPPAPPAPSAPPGSFPPPASPVPATSDTSPAATPSPPPPSRREQPEPDERNGLPVTGAQVGGMVVLGGGLVAAGIAMVAVRRRDLSDFDFADY